MEYTAFLDFWFRDRPLIERVGALVGLGIRRVDVWSWRKQPLAELAADWLKLPYTENYQQVVRASFVPVAILHAGAGVDEALEMLKA